MIRRMGRGKDVRCIKELDLALFPPFFFVLPDLLFLFPFCWLDNRRSPSWHADPGSRTLGLDLFGTLGPGRGCDR